MKDLLLMDLITKVMQAVDHLYGYYVGLYAHERESTIRILTDDIDKFFK